MSSALPIEQDHHNVLFNRIRGKPSALPIEQDHHNALFNRILSFDRVQKSV
jgi:hypothetical protein